MNRASPAGDRLVIVYPHAGHSLYRELAQRLLVACRESSTDGILCSSLEACRFEKGRLRGATAAVIAPAQCYAKLPDEDAFSLRLSEARKRLMFLAESIEAEWFRNQFRVPVDFDALVDIGIVSQEKKLDGSGPPYLFLFNGPTRSERRRIEHAPASGREIPWALVGHNRGGRAELARELTRKLDPRGVVFLPRRGIIVREDAGMIGPRGLDALLRRTRYYVWKSLHDFAYYESFRFREAVLAGAAPCKIEDRVHCWEEHGLPGIFPSAESFVASVENEGFETLRDSAREFYLSHKPLAEHLEATLQEALSVA